MEAYERLEQNWAEWNGLDPKGMVACSSGTAALHLALEAFRLPQNSQVINPDFSMIAVPRAIAMAGLQPVFVDCGDNLLMNPYLLAELDRNQGAKAIVVVHIYGRQWKVDDYMERGDGRWRIVEDLAEAHGVKPSPLTDAACWSFFQNKIVAGAEGGAVWFKDIEHAKLARQLRCLGFTDAHDFNHVPRGHNYRMSNLHAGHILSGVGNDGNLKNYKENLIMRRERELWYDSLLPQEIRMPYRDAPWVYDLRIPGMTAGQQTWLVMGLNTVGIRARHAFKPMTTQPEFSSCELYTKQERVVRPETESNADRLSREVIYLPLDPTLPRSDCVKAVSIVCAFLNKKETLLK